LFLGEEALSDRLPYTRKTIPSRVTGKRPQCHDPEFDKERVWLAEYFAQKDKPRAEPDEPEAAVDNSDEECEDGIECGCCFSKFAFVSPDSTIAWYLGLIYRAGHDGSVPRGPSFLPYLLQGLCLQSAGAA
jgi:hypothetical protein